VKDIPKLERETDEMICKFKSKLNNVSSRHHVQLSVTEDGGVVERVIGTEDICTIII